MKCYSLFLLPVLLVGAAIGCSAKPVPHHQLPAKTPPTAAASSAPGSALSNVNLAATGSHITNTDPKTGKILWTADVERTQAVAGQTASDVIAHFYGVHGVLYQNGRQANRFSAPVVVADYKRQTVTATGGVSVVSATQADTKLRCDKMTWYSATNTLIGVGHVVFQKGALTQTTPSFQADTAMRKVVMPAPGLAPTSHKPVHVRFRHG